MKNNINVCVVAGTHGDEYEVGSRVQRQVAAELPGEAYMLMGNERAVDAGSRYIDSDLNRAFGGDGTGYEAERVEEIRELTRSEGFTHVIDIHTSPTTHSIVPILPRACRGPKVDQLVNAVPSITNIVELPDGDKPYSLVADFGQGGIALECPRYSEVEIARRIAKGIIAMMKGVVLPPITRDIYQVDGLIPLDIKLPSEPMDDFKLLPEDMGLAFVADPSIYKLLGYGHQGMRVQHRQERSI